MKLKVNKDKCEIIENEIWNVGDYNVQTVQVELSDDFEGLVNKVRYFVEDKCYDILIENNIAQIPYEATKEEGPIEIGVYGFDVDTDILVQSTRPVVKYISSGTYTGEADNTEPLTPTDKQQIESAIQQNTDDIIVLQNNKQDVLISGENIKTINNESILGSGNIEIEGGGSPDYEELNNLPKVNNVTLKGNKTSSDLGLQPAGDYALKSELPTVPTKVSAFTNDAGYLTTHQDLTNYVTNTDYATYDTGGVVKVSVGDHGLNMENGTLKGVVKTYAQYGDMSSKGVVSKGTLENVIVGKNLAYKSDIPDVSNFITNTVNDLVNYYKKSETFTKQEVNDLISAITTMDIQVVQTLPTEDISTTTIYLVPKTTAEENDAYDEYIYVSNAWEHIGSTDIDLSGYQTKIDSTHKLSSDLVDDTNNNHKFVSSTEKTTWNGKYTKPSGGIPKTDLTNDVQTSLGKADTALQNYTETDPTVPSYVKSITQANITSWNSKADVGDIPTALSDLSDDSTHRLVTDTEKTTWNGKANVSDIPKIFYGTSATGASTAAKVVVCEEFTEADLVAGTRLVVYFTNGNTYNGQATLNVNSTGAKNIYYNGTTTNARYMWVTEESVEFIYNGEQWATINGGLASTTYYGVTKLATTAGSDSQVYALTPRALFYFANYSIAPYYSASSTYAVGDKVRNSYYIYECITAIETPEAWTAAHWQQIDTLQEQIDAINTTIGDIETLLSEV